MKLYSPIYPPSVKPARPGLYLTTAWQEWDFVRLYYWDGENWFDSSGKKGWEHMIGKNDSGQNRYWRGLAFDPKDGQS